MRLHDRHRIFGDKRRLPGDGMEQNTSERIDIRAAVDLLFGPALLR